jgi:hypothetical protein
MCRLSEIAEEDRFNQMTAFHKGEKMILKESNGLWGPVEWNNTCASLFNHRYNGRIKPNFPSFQIVLEYRPKPVAEVEPKLAHMSKLLDTELLADVQFIVKGKKIGAHLAIISAASPVMAAMFQSGNFRESSTRSVQVNDFEPEIFQKMLRYMYTGVAPDMLQHLEDLFRIADKYHVTSLKQECEQTMSDSLTLENVIRRLELAFHYSASVLHKSCLQFLTQNREEMWLRPEWEEFGKRNYTLFFSVTREMNGIENRKRKQ